MSNGHSIIRPIRLLDPDPSSAQLESLTQLAQDDIPFDEVGTAFATLVRQVRSDLAEHLALEGSVEPEVQPEVQASGQKRKGTQPGTSRTKRPRITRPTLPPSAPIPPDAQLLLRTEMQWDVVQSESPEGLALEVMADTRLDVPIGLTSPLVDKKTSGDEGTNPSARPLAPDHVHLYALPTEGVQPGEPLFVACLPLLNTQAPTYGPYPGNTTGAWILPATRLAKSQHVSIQASLRVEKAAVDHPSAMDSEVEAARNGNGIKYYTRLRLDVRV